MNFSYKADCTSYTSKQSPEFIVHDDKMHYKVRALFFPNLFLYAGKLIPAFAKLCQLYRTAILFLRSFSVRFLFF